MNKSGNFPVVGIIAEYNPFHNGHAYHIARAKELSGADICIVAMSGDFVQRGSPAVYDKYIRASMALKSGADLVVEMPSLFATSSAEDFAACGVALFRHLGVVSHLCFGSECGSMEMLTRLAHMFAGEPKAYSEMLRERLRQGLTFPEAREAALARYFSDGNEAGADWLQQVLGAPNNILGIEYCKALARQDSSITPITITRAGSGYHDAEFSSGFASATALRQALRQAVEQNLSGGYPVSRMAGLQNQMPPEVHSMLKDCHPLFSEDFSSLLNATLLNLVHTHACLSEYADVSGELEARLRSSLLEFGTYEERIQRLKTRQYTYTRVSRALLHVMLGIKKSAIEAGRELDYAPYARVLGFRKDSAGLLTRIKREGNIPLITKTADAGQILTPAAYDMIQQDFTCSHIYSAVWNGRYQRPVTNEFSRQIVIL